MKNLSNCQKNNDYIIGNLLHYLYHQNYKLNGIDLSRQRNASITYKINLAGNLEKGNGPTIISMAAKMILSFI